MRLRNIPRADSVLASSPQVIKNETTYFGKWHELLENDNPIHIEIGMGKGQFLLQLAARNPQINYIGIERYSSVLLRAVEKYEELADNFSGKDFNQNSNKNSDKTINEISLPTNIHFICMDATEIEKVFAPGEVAKIYLNFSDPWPKARHARRRLTSRQFFARYHNILTSDGTVEFKTDNRPLFDFSLEELAESTTFQEVGHTFDLHHDETMNQGNIMTEYEAKFSAQGNPICKLIAKRI